MTANGRGRMPETPHEAAEAWIASLKKADDLPEWVGDTAPRAGRDEILETYRGSLDLAGAAEALCDEQTIHYDQSVPEDWRNTLQDAGLPPPNPRQTSEAGFSFSRYIGQSFMGGASGVGDDWKYTTRGNCYEFVFLAGRFASADPSRTARVSNSLRDVLVPGTEQEWDGVSDIPRGKVIVGIAPGILGGQGSDNTYHFAVSLGEGRVANNRGTGAQVEPLADVFGGRLTVYSAPGGRIIYGDFRGFEPASGEPADEAGDDPTRHPNPRSATEQRRIVRNTAIPAGLATAALLAVFFGFGDGATTPVAATPTATTSEVGATGSPTSQETGGAPDTTTSTRQVTVGGGTVQVRYPSTVTQGSRVAVTLCAEPGQVLYATLGNDPGGSSASHFNGEAGADGCTEGELVVNDPSGSTTLWVSDGDQVAMVDDRIEVRPPR